MYCDKIKLYRYAINFLKICNIGRENIVSQKLNEFQIKLLLLLLCDESNKFVVLHDYIATINNYYIVYLYTLG